MIPRSVQPSATSLALETASEPHAGLSQSTSQSLQSLIDENSQLKFDNQKLSSELETTRKEREAARDLVKEADEKSHAYLFDSIKERLALQALGRENDVLRGKNVTLKQELAKLRTSNVDLRSQVARSVVESQRGDIHDVKIDHTPTKLDLQAAPQERFHILETSDTDRDGTDKLQEAVLTEPLPPAPSPCGVLGQPVIPIDRNLSLCLETLTQKILTAQRFFDQLVRAPEAIGLIYQGNSLSFTEKIDTEIEFLHRAALSEGDKTLLVQPEMQTALAKVPFIYLRLVPLIHKARSCELELQGVRLSNVELVATTEKFEREYREMNDKLLKTFAHAETLEQDILPASNRSVHLATTRCDELLASLIAAEAALEEERERRDRESHTVTVLREINNKLMNDLGRVESEIGFECGGGCVPNWRYSEKSNKLVAEIVTLLSLGKEYELVSKHFALLTAIEKHLRDASQRLQAAETKVAYLQVSQPAAAQDANRYQALILQAGDVLVTEKPETIKDILDLRQADRALLKTVAGLLRDDKARLKGDIAMLTLEKTELSNTCSTKVSVSQGRISELEQEPGMSPLAQGSSVEPPAKRQRTSINVAEHQIARRSVRLIVTDTSQTQRTSKRAPQPSAKSRGCLPPMLLGERGQKNKQ